jgi:hypothetical protein
MMDKMTLQKLSFFVFLQVLIVSCGTTGGNQRKYESETSPESLIVEFADSKQWEGKGKDIPDEGTCNSSKGFSETPTFIISNIPEGSNAIIMEYSDKSFFAMDNGGHGKIGYALPDGSQKVTILSIPSNTSKLPNGFWLVAKHKNVLDIAGEYPTFMPPCSGGKSHAGKNHKYSVTIKAVYHAPSKKDKSKLFGTKELELGTY